MKLTSEAEVLAAVQACDIYLHKVPVEMRTLAVCQAAAKYSPLAVGSFPAEFLTETICRPVLQKWGGGALKAIPVDRVTTAMCFDALANDAEAIRLMPVPMRSLDICVVALQKDPRMLEFVPPELSAQTVELILADMKDVETEWEPLAIAAIRFENSPALRLLVRDEHRNLDQIARRLINRGTCEQSILAWINSVRREHELCEGPAPESSAKGAPRSRL